tara:strand:- start:250 stop:1101 length:852 start_codon:yes stop_codon:yes gene_type:complete
MSSTNSINNTNDSQQEVERTIDVNLNTSNSENNFKKNETICDIPNNDSQTSKNIPITHIAQTNHTDNLPTVGPNASNSSTPIATPISYTNFEERTYSAHRPRNPLSQNNNFNENIYSTTHYVETPPEDQNLQKTWQYGKTIKCLSVIDSFFIVMNSLIIWPLIISIIFPICGYYGSKKYEVNKVFIYMFYCFIRAMSIVIQLSYSFKNINYYDDDYYHNSSDVNRRLHSNVSQVFLIFSLIIQLWITWIVYRFASSIRNLSHDKLNTLRIGTFIPIETRVLFY